MKVWRQWHAFPHVTDYHRSHRSRRAEARAGAGKQLQTMQRPTARLHGRLFRKNLPGRVRAVHEKLQKMMPGGVMVFPGIKNEKKADDLWAYLKQFDSAGRVKK
jgi:hypothetical protein